MGGTIRGQGNVTSAAEFNAWCDPEAFDVVLRSGAPLELVSWETTLDHLVPWSAWPDPLAAAAALDPACVIEADDRHVAIELQGTLTRGQTVVDERRHASAPPGASSKAMPSSACNSLINLRIRAWMVTSSAVVGSSAIINTG